MITQTMQTNAEEHENEVRRVAKVLRRRDVEENEEEGGTGDVGTEWTSMRREEEEMKIRDASREQEKKLRTEHLLKNGKVFCVCNGPYNFCAFPAFLTFSSISRNFLHIRHFLTFHFQTLGTWIYIFLAPKELL